MEETSFGVFTLKLMDLNLPRALRVSRLQVWLHPIPLRPFPLMSVPLANAKMKPDARLHAAPAESRGAVLDPFRSKPRAVILSPSGKGEGGLKQVPKASLLLFGTLVTSPLTRSAAPVRRRAGTALVHPGAGAAAKLATGELSFQRKQIAKSTQVCVALPTNSSSEAGFRADFCVGEQKLLLASSPNSGPHSGRQGFGLHCCDLHITSPLSTPGKPGWEGCSLWSGSATAEEGLPERGTRLPSFFWERL